MRLKELRPKFLKIESENSYGRQDIIVGSDGLLFLCPKCLKVNGMSTYGVHSVICWRPHVPQSMPPVPGRWEFQGTGYEDLTLVAGSSSILLVCKCPPEKQPCTCCKAHFFIKNGNIEGE